MHIKYYQILNKENYIIELYRRLMIELNIDNIMIRIMLNHSMIHLKLISRQKLKKFFWKLNKENKVFKKWKNKLKIIECKNQKKWH